MKNLVTIAILVVALSGCAAAPPPTPIAAPPAVVAKCGPPPTRSPFHENSVQYQQRVAVYMLCGRGDPAYPAALATTIQQQQNMAIIGAGSMGNPNACLYGPSSCL